MASSFGNRIWLTVGAVLALARCGGGGCACIQPLEGPFPEARKNAQVVQARITPEGFSFVGANLPDVVGSFLSMACDGPSGVPCPTGTSCGCPAGETCTACPAATPACNTTAPRQCIPAMATADPLLGFRVPASDGEDTDICTPGIGAAWGNCLIYARLKSSAITPTNATDANIRVTVDIFTTSGNSGGIVIEYDPWFLPATTCRIYPSIQNRAINATLRVGRDSRTDRATFDIPEIDVPFSGDDIGIDGGFLCDVADIGFIKNWIVGSFAGDLSTTLKDAMLEAMDPIRTQACDPDLTTYQCPRLANGEQTVCSRTDLKCHFASGTQDLVPGLLGVEGVLDLASSLGDFLTLPGGVAFTAYAGGIKQGGGSAAYFATGGLHVGMVGGAYAAPNTCVPPRQRDTSAIPTFAFPATVAPANGGAAGTYMLGAALHERLTQEVLGEAYAGGLLCQEITSQKIGLIHSGIIGLLLGEGSTLGELYRDNKNRPVIMALKPRAAPEVHIGLGRQAPDAMDPTRIILEEPLLALNVPNLDLDIYTLLDDRWVRLVTLTVDLVLGLGLEINAQNQVHLIANPVDSWIKNVRASNGDILNQTPEEIATAVPELLAAFLPQFAPSLDQTFDLPALQGFALRDVRFKGMEQTGTQSVFSKPRYRYLGLFANLAFNQANITPQRLSVETHATLAQMERPAPEMMRTTLGAQRQRVRARIAVDALGGTGQPLEHSYRINGGLWHPYMQGDTLWISDAELNLQGWHDVEVRSRVVDAPETLDETPAQLRILSDVEAPTLTVQRNGRTLSIHIWDRVTPAEQVGVRVRAGAGAWQDVPGGEDRVLDVGVDLDAEALVEVEAVDEAGLRGVASVGNPAWNPRAAKTTRTILTGSASTTPQDGNGGGLFSCAATQGPGAGILLLLLGLWLRPRRR